LASQRPVKSQLRVDPGQLPLVVHIGNVDEAVFIDRGSHDAGVGYGDPDFRDAAFFRLEPCHQFPFAAVIGKNTDPLGTEKTDDITVEVPAV
jgi:hypothetical protein